MTEEAWDNITELAKLVTNYVLIEYIWIAWLTYNAHVFSPLFEDCSIPSTRKPDHGASNFSYFQLSLYHKSSLLGIILYYIRDFTIKLNTLHLM